MHACPQRFKTYIYQYNLCRSEDWLIVRSVSQNVRKQDILCVAMDKDNTVSTAVEQLKSAGKDPSKQLPALVKLGDWYLNKAKTTSIASDFTKAAALYNAALERRRRLNKGTSDEQIRRGLVATYREFLNVFATEDKSMNVDDTQNEIRSHKEWIARERRLIKDRISSRIDTNDTQKVSVDRFWEVDVFVL